MKITLVSLIEYIPLQQGLRLDNFFLFHNELLIEYIPLQQGLRQQANDNQELKQYSLSIFHYNKD